MIELRIYQLKYGRSIVIVISLFVLFLLIPDVPRTTAQTNRSNSIESADLPLVNVIFRINGTEAAGEIYCNNARILNLDTEYEFLNGTTLSCEYRANKGYSFDSWVISNRIIKTKSVDFIVLKDEMLTAQFQDRRDPIMFVLDSFPVYYTTVIGLVGGLVGVPIVRRYERRKRKERKELFDSFLQQLRDTDTIAKYREREKSIKEIEELITMFFRGGAHNRISV